MLVVKFAAAPRSGQRIIIKVRRSQETENSHFETVDITKQERIFCLNSSADVRYGRVVNATWQHSGVSAGATILVSR